MLCVNCQKRIHELDANIKKFVTKVGAIRSEVIDDTVDELNIAGAPTTTQMKRQYFEYDLSLFVNYCCCCGKLIMKDEMNNWVHVTSESADVVTEAAEMFNNFYDNGANIFDYSIHSIGRVHAWIYLHKYKCIKSVDDYYETYVQQEYNSKKLKKELEIFVKVNLNNPSGRYVINGINYLVFDSYNACLDKTKDEYLRHKFDVIANGLSEEGKITHESTD